MRHSLLFLFFSIAHGVGCVFNESSGPAVNMLEVVQGDSGRTERSRGEVELYLTQSDPTYTFWNDWETKRDPWGAVTLQEVTRDGPSSWT